MIDLSNIQGVELPLSTEQSKLMEYLIADDHGLVCVVDFYANLFKSKGIEIFDQTGNILVTENCYYVFTRIKPEQQ